MNSQNFYYKKDRLNQLRGFCAVVKTGSVNKAKSVMGVEPTAISKQIIALERDLKIKLFTRGDKKKSLTLTENGKVFHSKAVEVLKTVDGLFSHFYNEIEEKNSSEIKIAAHHTCLSYMLPNYIKKYRQIYGNIEFKLTFLTIEDTLEALNNNEIDLAIYPMQEIPPGFNCKVLCNLDPILLIHKDNKLASKKDKEITFLDLSKQNLMIMDKNQILANFISYCDKLNISGNIKFYNVSCETMRNYVMLNLGVHLYSELYNKYPTLKNSEIISKDMSHLFSKVIIYLITKSGKIRTPELQNFIKIIEDNPLLQI